MSSLLGSFNVFLSVYAHWLLSLIFAPGLIGGKYSCDTASFWFLNFYLFRYPYNKISLFLYFSSEFLGKRVISEWLSRATSGSIWLSGENNFQGKDAEQITDQVPSAFYLFPAHLLHPAPLPQVLHFNPACIISLITYNSLVIYFTSTEIWSAIFYQTSTNYDLQSRDVLREH